MYMDDALVHSDAYTGTMADRNDNLAIGGEPSVGTNAVTLPSPRAFSVRNFRVARQNTDPLQQSDLSAHDGQRQLVASATATATVAGGVYSSHATWNDAVTGCLQDHATCGLIVETYSPTTTINAYDHKLANVGGYGHQRRGLWCWPDQLWRWTWPGYCSYHVGDTCNVQACSEACHNYPGNAFSFNINAGSEQCFFKDGTHSGQLGLPIPTSTSTYRSPRPRRRRTTTTGTNFQVKPRTV